MPSTKESGVPYNELNRVLNDTFFDGRFRASPVYLELEGEIGEEVADKLSVDAEDLWRIVGKAVRATLSLDAPNPYRRHIDDLKAWSKRAGATPPPFTALLCSFSAAAEKMRADDNFSSNNYYERLFEVLDIKSDQVHAKLKQRAKSTRQFWRALNVWLTENDFEFGRPTARQVTSWKYVSYALSQALVRDADRQRFIHLFELMGFLPGDDVTEGEMTLYIHEWMHGHAPRGPTQSLRRLWADADLRERVTAAALAEFEAWEGPRRSKHTEGRTRRLSWMAGLDGFPRARLSLALIVPGVAPEERHLALSGDAAPGASSAFSACATKLMLEPFAGVDVCVLEPTRQMDLGKLMLTPFQLVTKGHSEAYKFIPKPIIPLAKMESGPFFREVLQVSLFKPHHVLCHEKWLGGVLGYLELCARDGYEKLDSERVAGLPAGWHLLKNVEVVRLVDKPAEELLALVPTTTRATIEFTGGLKLGSNLWHADAPPVASATQEDGAFVLRLEKEALDEKDEILFQEESAGELVDADLSELGDLAGVNLRVSVQKGSGVASERHVSFRDASTPRPIRATPLGYTLAVNRPRSAISAEPLELPIDDVLLVRGLHVEGATPEIELQQRARGISGLKTVTGGVDELEGMLGSDYLSLSPDKDSVSCVIRGYHHKVAAPFDRGDDPYAPVRVSCKDCGYSMLHQPSRRRWYAGGRGNVGRGSGSRRGRGVEPVGELHRKSISPDALLDGACYLGQGNWRTLAGLASSCSDRQWYSTRFARDMASLGNIDIVLGPDFQPESWCIPPAVLVFPAHDHCFLSGFRSGDLVKSLKEQLAMAGAEYGAVNSGGSVTVHEWRRVSPAFAASAVEDITDPHGRPVRIQDRPAHAIAAVLPRLSDIISLLPKIHLEAGQGLSQLDLGTGRWNPCEDARRPGAYRVTYAGTRYAVRCRDGSWREGPYDVVKTVAAGMEGIRLHSYDEQSKTFVSALGCEPPGLYSRVLVACSGQLPEQAGGRLLYKNVPVEVAGAVLDALYLDGD